MTQLGLSDSDAVTRALGACDGVQGKRREAAAGTQRQPAGAGHDHRRPALCPEEGSWQLRIQALIPLVQGYPAGGFTPVPLQAAGPPGAGRSSLLRLSPGASQTPRPQLSGRLQEAGRGLCTGGHLPIPKPVPQEQFIWHLFTVLS